MILFVDIVVKRVQCCFIPFPTGTFPGESPSQMSGPFPNSLTFTEGRRRIGLRKADYRAPHHLESVNVKAIRPSMPPKPASKRSTVNVQEDYADSEKENSLVVKGTQDEEDDISRLPDSSDSEESDSADIKPTRFDPPGSKAKGKAAEWTENAKTKNKPIRRSAREGPLSDFSSSPKRKSQDDPAKSNKRDAFGNLRQHKKTKVGYGSSQSSSASRRFRRPQGMFSQSSASASLSDRELLSFLVSGCWSERGIAVYEENGLMEARKPEVS